MNKVILAAICEDVRREEGGKVSLMGVFDTLVVDFARPLPALHVFAQLGFEAKGEHTVVVSMRSEDGEYTLDLQRRVDATSETEAEGLFVVEIHWVLDQIRLSKPGRYRFYFVADFAQELSGPCFMAKASPFISVAPSRHRAS